MSLMLTYVISITFFLCITAICYPYKVFDQLVKSEHISLRNMFIFFGIFCSICCITAASLLSPDFGMSDMQYPEQANALLNGHSYLDFPVDSDLLALKDPYDAYERKMSNIGVPVDVSYYNNRYYCYFGVGPVLLLFVPYKFLTGLDLSMAEACMIFIAWFSIAMFCFLKRVFDMFSSNVPVYTRILVCMLGSMFSVCEIVRWPTVYNCALIFSMVCIVQGSLFYLSSVVHDKNRFLNLFIGSCFVAVSFCGRIPAALFGCLFLFFMMIPHYGLYLKKSNILKFLLCLIPYFVVACFLMFWNYVRYDDPFQFGLAYQLTGYNQGLYMSTFWSQISKNPVVFVRGFFMWFFVGLPSPFRSDGFQYCLFDIESGIFVTFPILILFPICIIFCKRLSIPRKASYVSIIVLILAVIHYIMTISVSRTLWSRYIYDVYYIMFMALPVLVCTFFNECSKKKLWIVHALLALSVLGMLLSFFHIFDLQPGSFSYEHRPEIRAFWYNLLWRWL